MDALAALGAPAVPGLQVVLAPGAPAGRVLPPPVLLEHVLEQHAGREDAALVVAGIADLMAMPSAGDLVLYGIDAAEGNVSYIAETGAHAGPSADELHTFLFGPADAPLPEAIRHPIELYPYFMTYQERHRTAA